MQEEEERERESACESGAHFRSGLFAKARRSVTTAVDQGARGAIAGKRRSRQRRNIFSSRFLCSFSLEKSCSRRCCSGFAHLASAQQSRNIDNRTTHPTNHDDLLPAPIPGLFPPHHQPLTRPLLLSPRSRRVPAVPFEFPSVAAVTAPVGDLGEWSGLLAAGSSECIVVRQGEDGAEG